MPRMLPLLGAAALAQSVASVPPGAKAITVMVCDQPDGCVAPFQAMADHCAALGVPLLDFDDVASAGPGGGDARADLDLALAAALQKPDLAHLEAARGAMLRTPLTLPADEPFLLWLRLGAARHDEGDLQGADRAFAAAASTSGARVYDLPRLSPGALDRYLELASRRGEGARLLVSADHPGATVFIDGRTVGAAPVEVELAAGWHRVSVERAGRRTAWVGEVDAPAGRTLAVAAELVADDATAALEAAVIGVIAGAAAAPDLSHRLAGWARDQGLSTVRFVRLREPGAAGRVPEERVAAEGGLWDVDAAWLDVGSARFAPRGPGPATLRTAADPDRFTLGMQLGYVRIQSSLPVGPDPHDHVALEAVGLVKLGPTLALDVRAGLWRAAQPWYLYEDWLSHELVPVSAGLRWSPGRTGLYGGVQALAIVPLAAGGQLLGGWTWRPTPRWRVGLEARGGYTDQGPMGGAGLAVGFAG